MSDEDLLVVESVAYDQLVRLGYEPHYPAIEHLEIDSTLEDKYTLENERLICKMNEDLAKENPEDLRRRQIQGDVLKRDTSHHYDGFFVNWPEMNIDDALDRIDELRNSYGLNKTAESAVYDFLSFPTSASMMIRFLLDLEVGARFKVSYPKKIKLEDGLSIHYAVATQGGYYPDNKTKPNQDAYLAGETVVEPESVSTRKWWRKVGTKKPSGALFGVFDGHGESFPNYFAVLSP